MEVEGDRFRRIGNSIGQKVLQTPTDERMAIQV